MKTSASNTIRIDRYLLQQMPAGNKLLFDAELILYPQLNETLEWQRKVHQLAKLRGRQKLQAQIKAVEQKLFEQPQYAGFRQRVMAFFGR